MSGPAGTLPGRGRTRPRLVLLLGSALLAGFSSGCQREPAPDAGGGVAVRACQRTECYFGLSKPDGGTVTPAEWQAFLDGFVTPRFPDGLTLFEGTGQWRGKDGIPLKEPCRVLVIAHQDTPATRLALDQIVQEYKRRFAQEAVLRLTQPARLSY